MKRTTLFLLAVTTASSCLFSQTTKNPFSELGYKKQITYTSSKGEFEEFHDNADVVEIGSVYFNTKTNKIVGYVNKEKENAEVATATSAMSVDPMCEKYYWISPYAYCLNNPVKFVDPDGRVPRIYVETQGVGHAFITTGEGKNTTVYTYGRYGDLDKNKSSSGMLSRSGEGVLIIMKGEEALNYIKQEYKGKEANIYEITNGSDAKIDEYFNKMFESSDKKPSGDGKYANAENARVVDTYDLFENNCTTKTVEAAKVGTDGKLDLKSTTPANADTKLYYEKDKENSQVEQVHLKKILDEYNK